MTIAVKVEGLSKQFLLGQTFERTLTSRVGEILRGRNLFGRPPPREEFWALRDVGFDVEEGEAMGIVGGNGAGKSTLLKILSRITPPTSGRAFVRGRLSSLLEVGTGFHPELTGRENVFLNGAILGMRKAEVERKFDEIVAFSGVEQFIDTPVKRYSSGMYVRLAFAVAAHLEPDVLIIDEVLAVGDADFQKRCLGKMGDVAREGRTVLFVSHNMAAVQKLCSRAVWLRGGQVAKIGEPGEVIGSYLSESGARSDHGACRPGYLYYDEGEPQTDVRILSVQLLDAGDEPMEEAATLERVRFRIGFESRQAYRSFAVEMQVNTPDGVSVLRTSTTPVHRKHFPVEPGRYFVDCDFPELPLAAGDYQLAMSLAIPGVEYLWREDGLCALRVAPRDVFESGQPPSTNRYLVAARHDWTYPRAAP